MAEKVYLNKKTSDELPKLHTREVNLPGVSGTIPFAVGETVATNTDKPMPTNLQKQVEQLINSPVIMPSHVKNKSMTPPTPINLDDLPADKQDEILEALKSAELPTVTTKPIQPVSKAYAAQPKTAAPVKKEVKATEPAPVKQEKPAEDDLCWHCGWPRMQTERTNPTQADKHAFVAAVLGQKRFHKTYELLGTQFHVTFRSLTTAEEDLIVKQMISDWNAGKISGPAVGLAEATKYQLALALHSIETTNGTIKLPELTDYEGIPSEGNSTILPDVVEHVHSTALKNEHTRRVVSKAYGHYVDTLTKLEVSAETPDFWQATVG